MHFHLVTVLYILATGILHCLANSLEAHWDNMRKKHAFTEDHA